MLRVGDVQEGSRQTEEPRHCEKTIANTIEEETNTASVGISNDSRGLSAWCIEDRANAHRAGNSPIRANTASIAQADGTACEQEECGAKLFLPIRSFYLCTCIVKHVPLSCYETGQGGPVLQRSAMQLAGPKKLFAQQRVPSRYRVHEGHDWYMQWPSQWIDMYRGGAVVVAGHGCQI